MLSNVNSEVKEVGSRGDVGLQFQYAVAMPVALAPLVDPFAPCIAIAMLSTPFLCTL